MAVETCVRMLIRGRVQGVGFRYSACEAASAAGVSGWVRNLPDGSVEVVAQGSPGAVARMTAWAHTGPRHASVDGVQIDQRPSQSDLDGFEIRG